VKQFCATGMPTCRDLMEHVEFVECEVIHGLGHTSMTMAQWLITNEMILASVSSHSIGCNKPDRGTDLRSSFRGRLLTCSQLELSPHPNSANRFIVRLCVAMLRHAEGRQERMRDRMRTARANWRGARTCFLPKT
jgi:hypothetical protein